MDEPPGCVAYDGKTVCGAIFCENPSPAFTPGDSGGPFYKKNSNGTVTAYGMVVAHLIVSGHDENKYGCYLPVRSELAPFSGLSIWLG